MKIAGKVEGGWASLDGFIVFIWYELLMGLKLAQKRYSVLDITNMRKKQQKLVVYDKNLRYKVAVQMMSTTSIMSLK